ncbi:hypothetical protein DFH27DRAFT_522837 [Peziza echinospora]|nr:hypothetical protein DFH27DRAFT_522837 [Peziza echinospora]
MSSDIRLHKCMCNVCLWYSYTPFISVYFTYISHIHINTLSRRCADSSSPRLRSIIDHTSKYFHLKTNILCSQPNVFVTQALLRLGSPRLAKFVKHPRDKEEVICYFIEYK